MVSKLLTEVIPHESLPLQRIPPKKSVTTKGPVRVYGGSLYARRSLSTKDSPHEIYPPQGFLHESVSLEGSYIQGTSYEDLYAEDPFVGYRGPQESGCRIDRQLRLHKS